MSIAHCMFACAACHVCSSLYVCVCCLSCLAHCMFACAACHVCSSLYVCVCCLSCLAHCMFACAACHVCSSLYVHQAAIVLLLMVTLVINVMFIIDTNRRLQQELKAGTTHIKSALFRHHISQKHESGVFTKKTTISIKLLYMRIK